MIGTILGGGYEILEEVGKGGMAYVYKAHCHMLNRTVAVKVLRNDLEGGDEFVQRFNTEAQSAAGLTHPNIVSVFDVGEDNGNYYIVMEYMEGITLKEYIKKNGRIESREAAYIAAQICSALEAAHEKNIVHRDIKPHNIMITNDNRVKVTDFGIARASSNSTMQVGDSILGSVHYISPEQARGGYVDCKSDIYSLGIVLYEMLVGHVPFESDSPIAVAMKHLEEKPVPPCEIVPEIPLELQEIVLKAMYKETRNRYQTVSAMKAELESIISTLEKEETETDFEETVDEATRVIPVVPDIEVSDDLEDVSDDEETEIYQVDNYDEEEETDNKKPSVVNMLFAAVLIAFLLVGGVSLGVTWLLYPELPIFNLFSNSDITVPNFVGEDYEKAQDKARSAGLLLEIGDRISSAQPINTVVEQTTAEGRKVKRGETIVVYISEGPGQLDVEEYIGMKYEEAVEDLEDRGYKVTVKKKSDTEIAENCVISVKKKDTKITLYVSKGYGDIEVIVPNVVGKPLDVAEKLLDENTLIIGKVEYVDSDIYEAGTVVNQDIASGEKVTAKTPINVTVAGKVEEHDKNAGGEKAKIISIALPTDRNSVHVKAVTRPSGGGVESTIYESTLNPHEKPEVVLRVLGTSKLDLMIYFDGNLASTKTIDFTK